MTSKKAKQLPRWAIVAAVIATAGLTVWAMWQTGGTTPIASWGRSDEVIQQVWGRPPPTPAQPAPAQPTTALPAPVPIQAQVTEPQAMAESPALQVAGLPGVPIIQWGTPRPHGDRGACTNCHMVVRENGQPVPNIHSFSMMPHEFRGNCTNCHSVTVARGLIGSPVAGMVQAPAMAMQPMQPMPNEAEWRGLEVRPSSQGVVVTNADGTAARMGVEPGDVVAGVNAAPITTMADFVTATQNGDLAQGTLIVRRQGQLLAFELGPNNPPAAPVAPAPAPAPAPASPIGGPWGVPVPVPPAAVIVVPPATAVPPAAPSAAAPSPFAATGAPPSAAAPSPGTSPWGDTATAPAPGPALPPAPMAPACPQAPVAQQPPPPTGQVRF